MQAMKAREKVMLQQHLHQSLLSWTLQYHLHARNANAVSFLEASCLMHILQLPKVPTIVLQHQDHLELMMVVLPIVLEEVVWHLE